MLSRTADRYVKHAWEVPPLHYFQDLQLQMFKSKKQIAFNNRFVIYLDCNNNNVPATKMMRHPNIFWHRYGLQILRFQIFTFSDCVCH